MVAAVDNDEYDDTSYWWSQPPEKTQWEGREVTTKSADGNPLVALVITTLAILAFCVVGTYCAFQAVVIPLQPFLLIGGIHLIAFQLREIKEALTRLADLQEKHLSTNG